MGTITLKFREAINDILVINEAEQIPDLQVNDVVKLELVKLKASIFPGVNEISPTDYTITGIRKRFKQVYPRVKNIARIEETMIITYVVNKNA